MDKTLRFIYKNWKGDTAERHVEPVEIWFGATEWHKEEQWLLRALDLDKGEVRDFALTDIITWL